MVLTFSQKLNSVDVTGSLDLIMAGTDNELTPNLQPGRVILSRVYKYNERDIVELVGIVDRQKIAYRLFSVVFL